PLLSAVSRPSPRPTLFPYTTLFRSVGADPAAAQAPLSDRHDRPALDGVAPDPEPGDSSGAGGAPDRERDEDRRLPFRPPQGGARSEEHTSELQSRENLVCRLLLENK